MKNIKIAVACHKPSVLPNNPLFVPVQVGAALAARRMPGMRYDDEGENISVKNPSYCELTAQYWAWKNLDADYYGLCHYRRFLCFTQTDAPRNERKHIEAYAIDEYNLKRFGLEDEEQMRQMIEENDAVVGELQKVSNLYTPRGVQKTAYAHWKAHDRALIHTEDLDRMLEILDQLAPEIGKDAREYLKTNTFLGFNCFVLKRELFDELCGIEFAVLEQLEQQVDVSHYCQQLSRIYGFMGEIICSSYIYHLEKKKRRVKHVPILYFNYTDEIPVYEPINGKNTIPVVFYEKDTLDIAFGTIWRSFLDHIDENYSYDVLIESVPYSSELKKIYLEMVAPYENVAVRFLDHTLLMHQLQERSGKKYALLPFLPWVLPDYQRVLVFGSDMLFMDSVVPLWEEKLEDSQILGAPCDIVMQSRINDVYAATAETYVRKQMKDPYHYFSTVTIVWDFEKYRHQFNFSDIIAKEIHGEGILREDGEVLNVLCEGKTKKLDQRWNTWYATNEYLKNQLPYAPLDEYKALLKAQKSPAVICYFPDDPWRPQVNSLYSPFWNLARRTPLYERYFSHVVARLNSNENPKKNVLNRLFPDGGKMRTVIRRMFPQNTIRYNIVKSMMNKMNFA